MKKFLNTPVGSWLKVFAATIITTVVNNGSIFTLDWKEAVNAALISSLPVAINYFNSADPRYGNKLK